MVLGAPPAAGEEARPTLGGRPVLLPYRIDTAFATTHFGLQVGGAWLQLSDVPVAEAEQRLDLQLAGLMERFEVSVAPSPQYSFFLAGEGQVVGGLNGETALFTGARGGYRWDLGVATEVHRDDVEGLLVGLRFRVTGGDRFLVSPARLFNAFRDQPDRTLDDVLAGRLARLLLIQQHYTLAGMSLNVARVVVPGLVVHASGEVRGGISSRAAYVGRRLRRRSADRVNLGMGYSATWEWSTFSFLLGYRISQTEDESLEGSLLSDAAVQHHVWGGAFHTRNAFVYGLLIGGHVQDTGPYDQTLVHAQFSTRYFF